MVETGFNHFNLSRFDSVWRMTEAMPHQFECDEDVESCAELL